jgi:signal transduction histidine kinase
VIVIALIAISAVSIFLAYTSLQSTEVRLQLAATQELRKQLSEEANDATAAVGSNLDAIRTRLETAAESPLLQHGDSDQIRGLLDATQAGIQYDGKINYLDRNGIILFTTDQGLTGNVGSDRSDSMYYNDVKEKRQPVLTGLFKSLDNRNSVSVAVPVLGDDSDLNGVLAAILPVDSLAKRVNDRLPLIDVDQVFIISSSGTIMGYKDESIVGESIFDEFDATQNDIVSKNLQLMTEGKSGVFEYATQDGQRKIAAYSPLTFSGVQAWSVLITTPSSPNETFSSVLSDQRTFTIVAIVLIGIIAAIFMTFILTLNHRLHRTVQKQDVRIKNQLEDLQSAYERLTEQDKIKDEFINIAAHELRTPVLPIILSAEGLAEDLGTDNSKVEIILRNAKRINKLTNDILDVSRIKSNTFRLQKDKTNIKKLVEEVIQDILFKMAEDKNPHLKIEFESKLSPGREDIIADAGRLNQVLSNLLDNAMNFTDQGTITVTAQHVENWPHFVEIRVADTGKGIDPSIRAKLFEKFVTKSEKAKGTGLGLYLCKAIVEAHGGKIWAEDNRGGKGAVFAFTLPVSD